MTTLRGALLGMAAAASIASGAALAAARVVPAVLTRTVLRGETIGPADVRESEPDAAAPRPVDVTNALSGDAVIGMEATRLLPSGSLLHRGDVAPPPLVRRGETVAVSFDAGTLNIATQGRALASAGAGETVRVFIPATNRTLDATVAARGAVRLP